MVYFKNNLMLSSSQHQRRLVVSNKNKNGESNDDDDDDQQQQHFFVVDMDLTSQGDMCEEISHLSDPTNMSSTPINHINNNNNNHRFIPSGGRRLHSRGGGPIVFVRMSPNSSGSNNKRRLSATNLLKKPIAAIRQSFGGGNGNRQNNNNINNNNVLNGNVEENNHNGNSNQYPTINKQQQQRRSVITTGNICNSPIIEEERESGGASDTSPLTMIVPGRPIGVVVSGYSGGSPLPGPPPLPPPPPIYGTMNHHHNHHLSDIENRNPHSAGSGIRKNNNNNSNNNQSIFRDQHERLSSPSSSPSSSSNKSSKRSTVMNGTNHIGNDNNNMLLYQKTSMSWDDDDPFLVFDDAAVISTPHHKANAMVTNGNVTTALRGLTTTTTSTTTTEQSALIVKNDWQRHQQKQFQKLKPISSWWSTVLCCYRDLSTSYSSMDSSRDDGWSDRVIQSIVHSWGMWVLVISLLLFLLSGMTSVVVVAISYDDGEPPQRLDDGTASSTIPPTIISLLVDTLYGAVMSVTTVGPATMMAVVFQDDHTPSSGSGYEMIILTCKIVLMVCTMIYAMLGITSVGIFWGIYTTKLVRQTKMVHSNQQQSMKDIVMTTFCNDPNFYSSSRTKTTTLLSSSLIKNNDKVPKSPTKNNNKEVDGRATSIMMSLSIWQRLSSSRSVRIWFVPFLVVVLTVTLGAISGWNIFESIYYTAITACTLNDGNITPKTILSKVVAILLLPLTVSMTIRWWLMIVQWMVSLDGNNTTETTSTTTSPVGGLTPTDVRELIHRIQMEEGLLTRADFIEIMLLAMKKVDPQLISDLRNGFDCVTQNGAIDLTRMEWLDGAASRVGGSSSNVTVSMDQQQQQQQQQQPRRLQNTYRPEQEERTVWQYVLDWLLGEGGGCDGTDNRLDCKSPATRDTSRSSNNGNHPKMSSVSSV